MLCIHNATYVVYIHDITSSYNATSQCDKLSIRWGLPAWRYWANWADTIGGDLEVCLVTFSNDILFLLHSFTKYIEQNALGPKLQSLVKISKPVLVWMFAPPFRTSELFSRTSRIQQKCRCLCTAHPGHPWPIQCGLLEELAENAEAGKAW